LSELSSTGDDIPRGAGQRSGESRAYRPGESRASRESRESERMKYLDSSGSLTFAGKAMRDKFAVEIESIDRKLAKQKSLKTWREDMDELASLLGTTSRLSIDVCYECKVDDVTQRVIVGIVTTQLSESLTETSENESPPASGSKQ